MASNMYLISHQLYEKAIIEHKKVGFPAFWYKNAALVAEKLSHVDTNLDKIKLVKTSIRHFTAYLQTGTKDSDNDAIVQAIDVLHKRHEFLKNMATVEQTTQDVLNRIEKLGA